MREFRFPLIAKYFSRVSNMKNEFSIMLDSRILYI